MRIKFVLFSIALGGLLALNGCGEENYLPFLIGTNTESTLGSFQTDYDYKPTDLETDISGLAVEEGDSLKIYSYCDDCADGDSLYIYNPDNEYSTTVNDYIKVCNNGVANQKAAEILYHKYIAVFPQPSSDVQVGWNGCGTKYPTFWMMLESDTVGAVHRVQVTTIHNDTYPILTLDPTGLANDHTIDPSGRAFYIRETLPGDTAKIVLMDLSTDEDNPTPWGQGEYVHMYTNQELGSFYAASLRSADTNNQNYKNECYSLDKQRSFFMWYNPVTGLYKYELPAMPDYGYDPSYYYRFFIAIDDKFMGESDGPPQPLTRTLLSGEVPLDCTDPDNYSCEGLNTGRGDTTLYYAMGDSDSCAGDLEKNVRGYIWYFHIISDNWLPTSATVVPAARIQHTAVWTGSEMIVWGGYYYDTSGHYLNTGGKYDPATYSWTAVNPANAPSARGEHTAVWTDEGMVVWGGNDESNYLNTGGRYNPTSNSWTETSTTNAPSARVEHTSVWTGNTVIVWGGYDGSNNLNTGGRYDPSGDSWTATSTGNNVPSIRTGHSAVWAGSEMIVWGGTPSTDTGGRYAPGTDIWTPTSTTNAPDARYYHSAVWADTKMVVWGGYDGTDYLNTGGRYDPTTDSWTATCLGGVPSARAGHTAVWTGDVMIIWGGYDSCSYLSTGGKYQPSQYDYWTETSIANAPSGRGEHTAVWADTKMVVWGGYDGTDYLNTGGNYEPGENKWSATSASPNSAPDARVLHSAVWTGTEMIVWGGHDGTSYFNTGSKYDPATDSWTAISTTDAPDARAEHTSVWTGTKMVVWGGYDGTNYLSTGGIYNPAIGQSGLWTATSTTNAPDARAEHTAVWAGDMIVWGGWDETNYFNTGGRYDPTSDTWLTTSTTNAPDARYLHTAVWKSNSMMIIWGGYDGSSYFNTGGRYAPGTDTWTPTSTTNAPTARYLHSAVWTGQHMVVWGGYNGSEIDTGGRYDPSSDSWIATSTTNAPAARYDHTAVWTGNEMIIWGGYDGTDYFYTGSRYYLSTDTWMETNNWGGPPSARQWHTAVWTGNSMIIWGGYNGSNYFNTGGRYFP